MPSLVTCRSSSLCSACLRVRLYCLCFSWALCSVCLILPFSLCLASFQLCLPDEISAFLMTSNFFVAPRLKCKAAEDTAMTIRFLPYHLCLGHLFQANLMIDSFAFWCIQASIWWGVLAHSNDHRFSQGVPWKHYPSDVACLDLHHLFLNLHHELIGQYLCLSWFGIFRQRYKPAFISSCIFLTALSLSLVKAMFLFTLLRTAFP